jgi:chemotaxis protein methyltransferase CheR
VAESIVSTADYTFVADLLREQCALVLDPGKEYLISSRLLPIARRHGLAGIDQLVKRLRDTSDSSLVTEVVEAMVTTETSFFRDVHPFETLKKIVLPKLIELRRPQRQLNIWCAASSSGQEPYSIAMLLKEYFPDLAGWRINLTATDISHEMLQRSRAGRYSQLEVNRGLPTTLLLKWFRQESGVWEIDEQIRRMMTFKPMNLAQPWPVMPVWDLIFLRNVMIYFDNDVKKTILSRVSSVLGEDGYLVLGGAETTFGLDNSFLRVETLKSGFYQRKS